MLGTLHTCGNCGGEQAQQHAQAVAFYRLAAEQGHDGSQNQLGCLIGEGSEYVVHDDAESLRWHQLAAAQGNPSALFLVAVLIEHGHGVRKSKAEAIRWYKRVHAVGKPEAAAALQRLRA